MSLTLPFLVVILAAPSAVAQTASSKASDRTAQLGLSGMYERVALVGGTLHVESSPGAGTTIRARIRCTEIGEFLRR